LYALKVLAFDVSTGQIMEVDVASYGPGGSINAIKMGQKVHGASVFSLSAEAAAADASDSISGVNSGGNSGATPSSGANSASVNAKGDSLSTSEKGDNSSSLKDHQLLL
jgi:hypothetical protein